MCALLVDLETLVQINSIVEELLKQPSAVVASLARKLDNLIAPCFQKTHSLCRELSRNGDLTGNETCLQPRRVKKASQRQFDVAQVALFSTTTTATGLPKEEPVPVKTKRLPKIPKEKSPINTPVDLRNGNTPCECFTFKSVGRRRTCPTLPQTQKLSSPSLSATRKKYLSASSDYVNSDLSSPSIYCARKGSEDDIRDSAYQFNLELSQLPIITVDLESNADSSATNTFLFDDDVDANSELNNNKDCCSPIRDYQADLLESVGDWNFQIFELAEKTDNVLSQMAYKLFDCTGLFETFKIPKYEFAHFMMALERGYKSIPYHNKIHAADVLHGCWFLTTQEIPGFYHHFPLCTSDSSDSDSGMGGMNTVQVNDVEDASLAQAIPALELMSLYLAAAMHDYDHPGKTNAFLVETRHPLANVYNDRSVLENHHASASWELLYSSKKFDFLRNLDTAEWKRLRFLIVEAILATDLKKHFEILSQFSSKSQLTPTSSSLGEHVIVTNEKSGLNWSDDQHRLLVCQMVIKLADISGPAKVRPLHITWTKAICEEFFLQGDEERKLDMSVSPFMDRDKPQVAELQRTFINNLITPVLCAMHRSGTLAGRIPIDHELYSHEKLTREQNLLIEHLRSNLHFWKTTTYRDGHEEMTESFKYAFFHKFSCPNSLDEKKEATSKLRENKLLNGFKASHEDEVFEKTSLTTLRNGLRAHTDVDSKLRERFGKINSKQFIENDKTSAYEYTDATAHQRCVDKVLTSR